MLKLTVEAGEYLQIGEDIRVIYTGGSGRLAKILIDAPKSVNIARSKVLEKNGLLESTPKRKARYEADTELSEEAKQKIRAIIAEEKRNARESVPKKQRHIYTTF